MWKLWVAGLILVAVPQLSYLAGSLFFDLVEYLTHFTVDGSGIEKLTDHILIPLVYIIYHLSALSDLGVGILIILTGLQLGKKRGFLNKNWLIIAGQTSLSLYVFHIIFMWVVDLFLYGTDLSEPALFLFLTVFFFVAYLSLMSCWLKKFSKGPLELLMRRVF